MGFLDEIKNKMHLGGQQGYDQGYGQDDDYGYDDGYDDGYQNNGYSGASGEGFYTQDEPSNGLLGQTRRGEAESVAVYTRSGQLVGDDSRHATTYNPPSRSQDSVASGYRPGAYDTPSSYAENTRARAAAAPAPAPSDASAYASNIINATPQLPAYVLRPESYDDVETVVRRVRTKQPVALNFCGRTHRSCQARLGLLLRLCLRSGCHGQGGGRPRVHGAARRLRGQRFRSQEASCRRLP